MPLVSVSRKDLGVSGLLGFIGVPGPELLDSTRTSSSWIAEFIFRDQSSEKCGKL